MEPGWYPDPDEDTARRYWDGAHWSAPLAVDGEQPVDAVSSSPSKKRPNVAYGIGAAVVVAVIAAVAVFVLIGRGDDKQDAAQSGSAAPSVKIGGYGQQAQPVADKLGTCTSTEAVGDDGTTVRCVTADGSLVGVTTSKDADAQDLLIALIKDRNSGDCLAVLPGVIVSASDEDTLTTIVGNVQGFASRNGGYTLCPVS